VIPRPAVGLPGWRRIAAGWHCHPHGACDGGPTDTAPQL